MEIYIKTAVKSMSKNFIRKGKEAKPVVAICYDFDRTLSPEDMQAQGFIQSVGYDVEEFWIESNRLAEKNEMDQNLAYMYTMVQKAHGSVILNRENLAEYGSRVKLFPGVDSWFERTREYALSKGVILEHYIISSGLKEMIEGTAIAKNGAFEKIYASSFCFDSDGVAVWPAQAINYTNKTQFLFRIEKGTLEVNDPAVNDYFAPDKIRVPFRNIVYIGDSDTDIPCMKLVNAYGGYSIGVYDPKTEDKNKVFNMLHDDRIKYFAPADYTENGQLESLVKMIIDKTAANELIEAVHYDNVGETAAHFELDTRNSEQKQVDALVSALSESENFRTTHTLIEELSRYADFTQAQLRSIAEAAQNNSQVYLILGDSDVKEFYKNVLEKMSEPLPEGAKRLKEELK